MHLSKKKKKRKKRTSSIAQMYTWGSSKELQKNDYNWKEIISDIYNIMNPARTQNRGPLYIAYKYAQQKYELMHMMT